MVTASQIEIGKTYRTTCGGYHIDKTITAIRFTKTGRITSTYDVKWTNLITNEVTLQKNVKDHAAVGPNYILFNHEVH